MSLTASAAAMRHLLPLLEGYFVEGLHEGLALVAGPEWELEACPFAMRHFEEYSLQPPSQDPAWQLAAARRALLEERPQLLLTSSSEAHWSELQPLVEALAIEWLVCKPPKQTFTPSPAVNVLGSLPELEGGSLSRAEQPEQTLREMLAQRSRWDLSEPVNLAYSGSRVRFRYAGYDNEFALQPASHDLQQVLRSQLKPEQFRVQVSPQRWGTAGTAPWLEAPDGIFPQFQISIDLEGVERPHWTQPFATGSQAQLKLLLVDLHNVAGSGMQHSLAINRHSRSRAHVLCREPHPFIPPASPDCRVIYTAAGWTPEILALLQEADILAFFEEDDAETLDWPDHFKEIARRKPSLHFYVGQRVHRGVAARQRPGRQVLAALPHILRMYPQSKFYVGFYPPVLEDLELRPPRSQVDGQLRVLHTPSLPHPTSHRYLYHKDTAAFLNAAQWLKPRYPEVQFLQWAGIPHQQILQARLDCDIAFHQLRGFMGMTGNESMFLGRPTIQAFDQANTNRHLEYWGLDCQFPWLPASRADLHLVLEGLIRDPDRRAEAGARGRTFMLENFNAQVGIQTYLYYALQAVEQAK